MTAFDLVFREIVRASLVPSYRSHGLPFGFQIFADAFLIRHAADSFQNGGKMQTPLQTATSCIPAHM
jgi:hypothetical protein